MKRGLWLAGFGVLALCGCGNFFTKQTTTTGTTTPTNTTAGNVLYVANLTASKLAAYTVSTSGALTAVSGSPVALSEPPSSIAISPSNTYLYVGTATGILGYAIGTGGVLTALNGGAALVADVLAPTSMQVDTTGNYLLAAGINLSSGTNTPEIGVYEINTSTGTLAAETGSPLAVSNGNAATTATPTQLYIAPNDAYVYLTLGTGGTEVLSFVESNAALSDTGQYINLLTNGTSQNQVVANAASTILYMTETGVGVRVFSLASTGLPTEITGSPFAAGTGPGGITLDGTGTYLYVANKGAVSSDISGYSVAASGGLTALASSPYAAGSLPVYLTLDQSKKFLAVANEGGTPDVGMYSFDATTLGKLDGLTGASFATGAYQIVSPQ